MVSENITRLPLGAEPGPSDRQADQCRAGSGPDSQSGPGGAEPAGRRRAGASRAREAARLGPTPAVGPDPAHPRQAGRTRASGCGQCSGAGAARGWERTRRADLEADPLFPTPGLGVLSHCPGLLSVATTASLSG